MSLGADKRELRRVLNGLLSTNAARIFPSEDLDDGTLCVQLRGELHAREDMFHHPVDVYKKTRHGMRSAQLWLKARPGLDAIFPLLTAYYDRLGEGVFPKPICCWRAPADNLTFIVTRRVNGQCLRDRLLKLAFLRRTGTLQGVFESSGAKMRRFHDAFRQDKTASIPAFFEKTRTLVTSTTHFNAPQRTKILEHLAKYEAACESIQTLPILQNHHDWTLRNIIIDENGIDYVIDFDSMQAPLDLRWVDISCLLLNIESQIKWAPLTTIPMLSSLWDAFWSGYVGSGGIPDGLCPNQAAAIIYAVRINYLLGGTFRQPYMKKFNTFTGRRFLKIMQSSVAQGHHTIFHRPAAIDDSHCASPARINEAAIDR
jgi:hypothetical protein